MGDCGSTLAGIADGNMTVTKSKKKENGTVVQGRPVTESTNKNTTQKRVTEAPNVDPASRSALEELQRFLEANEPTNDRILDQPFASVALTKEDAHQAEELLWKYHAQRIRQERADDIKDQQVTLIRSNGKPITMKYWSQLYSPTGTQPKQQQKTIPLFIGFARRWRMSSRGQ